MYKLYLHVLIYVRSLVPQHVPAGSKRSKSHYTVERSVISTKKCSNMGRQAPLTYLCFTAPAALTPAGDVTCLIQRVPSYWESKVANMIYAPRSVQHSSLWKWYPAYLMLMENTFHTRNIATCFHLSNKWYLRYVHFI